MEHKNCLKKVTAVFSAHEAAPIWKLRHFAVLALLTEIGGELHFILTKRAAGVNSRGMSLSRRASGTGRNPQANTPAGNRGGNRHLSKGYSPSWEK